MEKEKVIGIDLGTTNSVAAIADGPRPRVLDSREARPQTRSVVGQRRKSKKGNDPPEILVGDAAYDNWELAEKDTILSIKRLMGRGVADPEVLKMRGWALYEIVEPTDGTQDSVCVVLAGRQHTPIDISSMILNKVKEDAEFRLGGAVTHAVITVPAYFSQIQRDATRRAAWKAGLKVIKILDEPTAVAIAFGMESPDQEDVKRILVYDLGGGTFDVSVLLWSGCTFAPLTIKGDMWLGGDNFDQALVEHVVKCIKQEHGIDCTSNKRFMVVLKKKAQIAKEHLSSARTADIIVPGILKDEEGDPIDIDLLVTREEYERLIMPLRLRTVEIVRQALADADLKPDEIDHVLMAGNATCDPLIQRAMEEVFGKDKVLRRDNPKHGVALGAAIVAARLGARLVCDCGHVNQSEATACEKCRRPMKPEETDGAIRIGGITAFHYGIQTAGDVFRIFIKKNDPYPTLDPQPQPFSTRTPNQRMMLIPVYGGENLAKASANEKQGEAFAILPPRLPTDTPVRIKLWLDGDGVFDLTAHLADGTDLKPSILKGGKDQKTVEVLKKLEEWLCDKAKRLSTQEQADVQRVLDEALDAVRKGDFDQALRVIQDFQPPGPPPPPTQITRAENLIGFTEFVLHEYSWALDPNLVYRLNKLIEETRQAVQKKDEATLKAKADALDRATDHDKLPDVIAALLALRGAILGRIRPENPVVASKLMQDYEEVVDAMRTSGPSAVGKLNELSWNVAKAIEDLEDVVDPAKPCPIATCRKPRGGAVICPHCGDNIYVPKAENWSSGSSGVHSK